MSFMDKVKSVLSSKSVVEKAADAAINGLDAIWHTPEEKEGDRQKRMDQALKFLELTKGSSPARRHIAMIVMALWAIVGLNIIILMNLSGFVDPVIVESASGDIITTNPRIDAVIKNLTNFAGSYIMPPSAGVLGFYFMAKLMSK